MTGHFKEIISKQKLGIPKGIYSVCSAHPFVLGASFQQAAADNSYVLIESTSNQVDQFGGYTGMKPVDFVSFVHSVASKMNFPPENVILGGDHLGPNVWSGEPSETAMAKAGDLVEAYVAAGYRKIHLDASMHLADDSKNMPLSDETVAGRAAELCLRCEKTYDENPRGPKPVYVIGTEVPVPGGAKADDGKLQVTSVNDVRHTLDVTKSIFESRGLAAVWDRVIAVVVQPGVEFGDSEVIEYDRSRALELSKFIEQYEGLIYEAHSTDYQTPQALSQLVEDHYGILKVGPWLTFSMREAILSLSEIESEILPARKASRCSNLPEVMENVMLANPKYWKNHYRGSEAELALSRKFSFSDRCRYYWTDHLLIEELNLMLRNLSEIKIPLTLLSQFMPVQYNAVREGMIAANPEDLIRHKIREVLNIYSEACRQKEIFENYPLAAK